MNTAAPARPEPSPFARLAVDLGPLVAFFLTNQFAPVPTMQRIYVATFVFMAATAIAMLYAKFRHGKISPMLIMSGVMVLGFGGLTLWLQSETFIKIKPTAYYVIVAGILFFGLATNRPTLKIVLGAAYPGLTDKGWSILSRNWAFFFIALAIANEIVWRSSSTDFWLGYKLWGAFPATIAFALANVPMLMRHGMNAKAAEETLPGPPEG